NKGGLVMPIILEWTYKDGTKEIERIPAQVWRKNEGHLTKLFVKDKEVESIKLDPNRETADIDESNNSWPTVRTESKFEGFKANQPPPPPTPHSNNPMKLTAKNKKDFYSSFPSQKKRPRLTRGLFVYIYLFKDFPYEACSCISPPYPPILRRPRRLHPRPQ